MRDRSVIPTNLPDWPRVSGLLPEQKLILGLGFWGGRYTNSIGIATVPLRPLAASLGLDPAALQIGIKTLCAEQLLLADWQTYEFFIRDWFRFHTFRGAGIVIAKKEVEKIASRELAAAVLKEARWLAQSNEQQEKNREPISFQRVGSPTAAAKPSSAAAEKIRFRRESGIVTFLPIDSDRASALEENYTQEQINAAIVVIEEKNKEPVPGLIQKQIEIQLKAAKRANLLSEQEVKAPPPELSHAEHKKWISRAWSAIGKPTSR